MERIIRLCGIAVAAMLCAMLLKEKSRVMGSVCVMLAFVLLCTVVSEGVMGTGIGQVLETVSDTEFYPYAKTLAKALCIAYIASITETVCTEAGENTLAGGIRIAGRAELVMLCIPLIKGLLDIAGTLM